MNNISREINIKRISPLESEVINNFYFEAKNRLSAKFGQGRLTTIIFLLFIAYILLDLFYGWFNNFFANFLILISVFGGIFRYCAIFYEPRNKRILNISENEENFPIYSILIALYDEACVIKQLISKLNEISWPSNQLDIIFICEEDDEATIFEISQNFNQKNMRLIIIGDGMPRTKARALNIGLLHAKGEYICVYDAEDEPDKMQLREAFLEFQNGKSKLAVVQAPLIAKNNNESFIAAQFALDYAVWFRVLLPFIAKITGFIPLGGTSNHFRASILKKIGGWDPYNLTEDADLGVRIALNGYHAQTIFCPTIEEAPPKFNQWLRQRSRWIQGHLQTIGVHFSSPVSLINKLGFLKFLGLVIGVFLGPIFIILRIPLLLSIPMDIYSFNNNYLYFWLFGAFGLELILNTIAIRRDKRYSLFIYIGFLPIYWVLLAFAYCRASILLFTKPFQWEKTPHGSAARVKES